METTTTFFPDDKTRFYLCLPCSILEQRSDSKITFSLPAGKAFPTDLRPLMMKTKRVLTFEDSSIVGVDNPACSGTDCYCQNCAEPTTVCEGIGCKGYTSSTDSITCTGTSCTPTNNVSYTMWPLYPPSTSFVSEQKPKIGFIRYESSRPSSSTPPPPISSMPPMGDYAIFSITYPDPNAFSTTETFSTLFDVVMANIGNFQRVKNGQQFVQHNMGILQRLQRRFKLDTSSIKSQVQGKRSERASAPPQTGKPRMLSSEQRQQGQLRGTRPPMTGTPGSFRPQELKFMSAQSIDTRQPSTLKPLQPGQYPNQQPVVEKFKHPYNTLSMSYGV